MKILIATTNPGKVREVSSILSGSAFHLVHLADLRGVPVVEETGNTFEDNALQKSRDYAAWSGLSTLADDSGLVVPGLGGEPGVHSARYAGVGASDEDNLKKLIHQVELLPETQRQAYYVCVLALVDSVGKELVVEGRCDGEIILQRRGSGGFGYDPVFFLPELGQTMAEIPLDLKNQISHRGKALQSLKSRLDSSSG